jgi:hypothetical protein
MISNRSKLSLSQFLSFQDLGYLRTLLYKHGIVTYEDLSNATSYTALVMDYLRDSILWAKPQQLLSLLGEIIKTGSDLRGRVISGSKSGYDERWVDLVHCLALDGYKIESLNLIPIEPMIEGAEAPEDALTS